MGGRALTAVAAREQLCQVGEIEICFEEIGDPDDAPLLLIMGLGGADDRLATSSASGSPRGLFP